MQSIAAVPAVATTPTTSAITSQTLGVTSTWSGGRGSGMQTIREGGSGYVEVAGSRGYRDDLVPVGYCVTDTVRSCAGDYSRRVRRCGGFCTALSMGRGGGRGGQGGGVCRPPPLGEGAGAPCYGTPGH